IALLIHNTCTGVTVCYVPFDIVIFSSFFFSYYAYLRSLLSFPTRRSSDLAPFVALIQLNRPRELNALNTQLMQEIRDTLRQLDRSEEHTSELQSRENLVCRLLLEKKKT